MALRVCVLGFNLVPGQHRSRNLQRYLTGCAQSRATQAIHLLMDSLRHSFIRSFIHSFIHSFIQSFSHSVIPSISQSIMQSINHSIMQSLNHSIIRSFQHSFIHSSIHSFIHSFIHSLIHWAWGRERRAPSPPVSLIPPPALPALASVMSMRARAARQ